MLPPAAALVVAALVVPGGEALPEEGLVRRDGGRGGVGKAFSGLFSVIIIARNARRQRMLIPARRKHIGTHTRQLERSLLIGQCTYSSPQVPTAVLWATGRPGMKFYHDLAIFFYVKILIYNSALTQTLFILISLFLISASLHVYS